MRTVKLLVCSALILVGGCKDAHLAHQPGPIIALYLKDGGPAYESSPGTYNRAVVDKFFESRPDVIDSFVNNGVCNNSVTDTASDEATQNSMICQIATSASMKRSLQKDIDANR